MQMMRLELALLDQVHHACDAGESERAVSDQRDRGVKFQPRICRQPDMVRFIDWRDQRKQLQQDHQRRSECAHQRKPICWPNDQVEKRDRPRDENNHLK